MKELVAIVRHLTSPAESGGVLATLVSVAGSSYRRAGARLLLTEAGQRIGSISGGCLEDDVLARANRVAESGQPEVVTYDTTTENDLVWGVGLGCHGVVQVFLEKLPSHPRWAVALGENLAARRPTAVAVTWRDADPSRLGTRLAGELSDAPAPEIFHQTIEPPPALTVFGAGDDARPLVRLARELGWHVTVADPRAEYTTLERFPDADRLVVAPAADLVRRAELPADALAVVMTHRYVHDVPVLRALTAVRPAYVGLLGPRQRATRILSDLARDGVTPDGGFLARLHAPVGLDLGAETPEEVALSIVAEIRAALAGRDARPLRERTKPIHD